MDEPLPSWSWSGSSDLLNNDDRNGKISVLIPFISQVVGTGSSWQVLHSALQSACLLPRRSPGKLLRHWCDPRRDVVLVQRCGLVWNTRQSRPSYVRARPRYEPSSQHRVKCVSKVACCQPRQPLAHCATTSCCWSARQTCLQLMLSTAAERC